VKTLAQGRIRVDGLTVRLRRERTPSRSLREYLVAKAHRRPRGVGRFEVLRDVSFEVGRGQLFAVVGPNGAGKTTMLRVLAGVIPPAFGRVSVDGRVAPLIELGAGFDPELTGAENIFLYGSLLGMTGGEIRRAHDEVVDFAGVEGSLDVPVRHYSSGMLARLGFAIATVHRPDVLLVDEVLAVGDEQFRVRCRDRISELRDAGAAIVLVTHDLALVASEADLALHLHEGCPAYLGSGADAVSSYQARSTS
jgi:ABC-type polysaccharide/polyol phosphate transport system ATPase subunit